MMPRPALDGCDDVLSLNPNAPGSWPEKTKTRLLAQIATGHCHLRRLETGCQPSV